jgi:hypothetical protein
MGNDGHWSQQGPSPSGNTWANSSPYPYYPPPNPPAVAYTPANQAPSTNAWDVLNTVVDQAGDYFNNN